MNKIFARDCEVKKIDNVEAIAFLNEYHKQGGLISEVCYGLFYNDELVQVETFGQPRIENQNGIIWHDWELLRECSKKDYQILGGKSKLLKAFENECKPLSLLSYCNTTEGFDGHSYEACGFHLDSICKEYWYEYNGDNIQRYSMQKNRNLGALGKKEPIQKTLEKYGKTYDPNLTEKENAANAGFKKVIGKGQQTWSKYYAKDIGYIYLIENTVNGKRYVGQHTLVKNGVLKSKDYFGSGVALQEAVKKYGKRAFKRKALEWTTDLSKLTELEYKYINELQPEYNLSFNPNDAAAHVSGTKERGERKHSEETKKAIGLGNLGKVVTEEQREKISASLVAYYVNNPVSDERKALMSKRMKKDNPSKRDDVRKKLSENAIRHNQAEKLNSQDSISKRTETLKNKYSNMSEEERKAKYGWSKKQMGEDYRKVKEALPNIAWNEFQKMYKAKKKV